MRKSCRLWGKPFEVPARREKREKWLENCVQFNWFLGRISMEMKTKISKAVLVLAKICETSPTHRSTLISTIRLKLGTHFLNPQKVTISKPLQVESSSPKPNHLKSSARPCWSPAFWAGRRCGATAGATPKARPPASASTCNGPWRLRGAGLTGGRRCQTAKKK